MQKIKEEEGGKKNRINEAERLMRENLENILSISQIARRVSMAESHFHRSFKQNTGCTPYQYYLQVRLLHASDLLKQTDTSIERISSYIGFTEISSFNRAFKKHFSLSPTAYREIHKKQQ